jgi:phosphatidylserine/phosphatidylglycerophosphate/cardiolipin synthase-like enzyme
VHPMNRTLLPLCLALVLSASPASASPDLDGVYRIQGRDASGQSYLAAGRLAFQGPALVFERTRSGESRARGSLSWQNGAWQGQTPFLTGLSGALSGQPMTPGGLEVVLQPTSSGVRVDWTWKVSGVTQATGSETWQPATLPATPRPLSPLFQSLVDRTKRAASEGTVPANQIFTQQGNHVARRVLIDGPEIFAAAARLIETAEREVLIQSFHWQDRCEAADRIVDGLKALQARRQAAGATTPVRVHLVVDHNRLIGELRRNPSEAAKTIQRANLDPRYVKVEQAKHTHWLFGALHSKSFVIDGERAMVLSANVHDFQDANPTPWHELGFEVAGPVARSLRADFTQLWKAETKQDLSPLPPLSSRRGDVPVLVTSRPWKGNLFSRSTKDPAAKGFLTAIGGAQSHIRIMTPHLNAKVIRSALVAAAKRGIRVELLISKGFGNGRVRIPSQGGTNEKNVKRLRKALRKDAAANARVDIRWFSRDGKNAIDGEGPGANHGKWLTVDDRIAIVGASNLDNQSLHFSREINLVVEHAQIVSGWDRQVFLPAFARGVKAN